MSLRLSVYVGPVRGVTMSTIKPSSWTTFIGTGSADARMINMANGQMLGAALQTLQGSNFYDHRIQNMGIPKNAIKRP